MHRMPPSKADALDLAKRVFGIDQGEVLGAEVDERLMNADVVFSFVNGDTMIGFVTLERLFDDVLYLTGAAIDPPYQGQGLTKQAIRQVQQEIHTRYLVFRTQSIHAWKLAHSYCDEIYPSPGTVVPGYIDEVAGRIKNKVGVFPVTSGHYGGKKFHAKPIHADSILQTWWDGLCDFEHGDAVVCIGVFPAFG